MKVIFNRLKVAEKVEKIAEKPAVTRFLNFAKSNRILVRLTSICLIGLIALSISLVSTGITFGFEVNYGGSVIATVASESVYENAKQIAVRTVNSAGVERALKTPEFSLVLTLQDKLEQPDDVAVSILENTGKIVMASELFVNGQSIIKADSVELNTLLQERLNAYHVAGADNRSSFIDNIEVIEGYYLNSDLEYASAAADVINGLGVKTVSTLTSDKVIPFTTRQVKTSSQVLGWTKVTTAGQNGLKRTTEKTETVNGQVVATEILADQIIAEPVQQVITVGTAIAYVKPSTNAGVSSAGFICPLPSGKFVVSSYYGDGRNHKGIDLAANRGTAIFAVADGVVTLAGYSGNYGYCVLIDHGNGIQTRYAHASALCVKKGQTVSQGDMVAAVGSTGQSTGNHLHFEVIINGVRVNPAKYIGL